MSLRFADTKSMPARVSAVPSLLLFLFVAGCGSTPETTEREPQSVPAIPSTEPTSGAQTFPLEGAPTSHSAPAQRRTTAPAAATPSDGAPTDSAAEPPLPPEAVQQFENALTMVDSGNLAGAEAAFRALSTTYPSYSGPLVNLGILQSKAGRLEEAEKTFQEAIARKPDNAYAHNQLGIVYRHQGRFTDAERAYERAIAINPNYANAHLNLGVLCDLYLQQPQRALEAFERYQQLSSAPDEKVGAWIRELKVRIETAQRASGA